MQTGMGSKSGQSATGHGKLEDYFDHLYFSIISIGVGAIVLDVILYGIGAESATISNHLLAAGLTCGVLCLGSALFSRI